MQAFIRDCSLDPDTFHSKPWLIRDLNQNWICLLCDLKALAMEYIGFKKKSHQLNHPLSPQKENNLWKAKGPFMGWWVSKW